MPVAVDIELSPLFANFAGLMTLPARSCHGTPSEQHAHVAVMFVVTFTHQAYR
ncbi:hypothetical protein KCP76_02955 [Salmonella enterica subsp. enterica serovar Weltevreden]|nr:hypothetical protein KCP76_02955 [Salmonella enterica subsp. enterica serovar Weltevreden]